MVGMSLSEEDQRGRWGWVEGLSGGPEESAEVYRAASEGRGKAEQETMCVQQLPSGAA